MVIKGTRIRTSTGSGPLLRHLMDGDDNEAIRVIQGHIGDVEDAVRDAKTFSRTYALRHWVIAPAVAMDHDQFLKAVSMLAEEFNFEVETSFIVEHTKSRSKSDSADQHWHIVVGEADPVTGRVLSSRFDRARHEKVARTIELMFGHPVVPGAHNHAVLAELRKEGKNTIADRLSALIGQGQKAVESYTTPAHQVAKKAGFDLAQARLHVRSAWDSSSTGDQFRARLAAHGMELVAGDKPGVIVVAIVRGPILGAANRLAGVRRTELNRKLERTEHDNSEFIHPEIKHRATNPGGHDNAQAGHEDHLRTGTGDSVASAGGGNIGARQHDRATENDRVGRGGQQKEHRGTSSAPGRARDRTHPEAYDRSGLTQAVSKSAAAIKALVSTGIGQPQAGRTRVHLDERERQARERIAAAKAPISTTSEKLHAAQIFKSGAEARYDSVLKDYRVIQERLAVASDSRTGVMHRLLGRQTASTEIKALERDFTAVKEALLEAEQTLLGATKHLTRVEKEGVAARAANAKRTESERRAAMELLGQVLMAKRMVSAFPALTYSGASFVFWAAGKVERKRRKGLNNPWAKNIWGIPIDFG